MKGRLYYNQHEAYVVLEDEKGRVVTRKVLSYDKEKRTCKIRMNKKIVEIGYHY